MHITLHVVDVERSLAFYTSIGFEVQREVLDVEWAGPTARSFGLDRARTRSVVLGLGDGVALTRLDLIQWYDPAFVPVGSRAFQERAPQSIAVRVSGVRELHEDLVSRGFDFTTAPVPYPDRGIRGVVVCRDPDGYLVQFVEYEPTSKGDQAVPVPTFDGGQI